MADMEQLRRAVERALAEVFAHHLPTMRDAAIDRVLEELGEPEETTSARLNSAAVRIQQSLTQAEILTTMLDGIAGFSGRAALFILRGGAAQGWQARGLLQNEAIKTVALDVAAGMVERAIRTRCPVAGEASGFDRRFRSAFGDPVSSGAVLVPLSVREKVAALVYADTGIQCGGQLDAPAVELLVRVAGNWIELTPTKKPTTSKVEVALAATAAAAGIAVAAPPVSQTSAPGPTPAMESAPAIQPEEEEIHRKAKRFAKLLVEEIKLYNQAKVAQGRQRADLYGLLREDIEKSRASYDKRYGQTPAASVDYFTQELVRILAEGDKSLLGGSFSR